jgi:hypothetical protein
MWLRVAKHNLVGRGLETHVLKQISKAMVVKYLLLACYSEWEMYMTSVLLSGL